MKILQTGILLGSLAFANAMAADHSVGIVNLGTGTFGAGTGLNLYSITNKGVDLVKGSPFLFPPDEPLLVAMAPAHDFVYVAYEDSPRLPIIVQYEITPSGLVYRWQAVFSTGDASLQGSSISAVSKYLIEYTYPATPEELFVYVLDQSGQELVYDIGTNGSNLVSAHIDPNGKFYYSCRYIASSYTGVNGPANAVAVYRLNTSVTVDTPPLLTSTDPVFVQSECN